MPYIGNDLATQFQAFATQTITGDGSTSYTLDRAVANGKELLVYINNVKQEEGSGKSYEASGTTITFSEAVASGDSCYLVYMGSAQQTVTAPAGSIVSNQFSSSDIGITGNLGVGTTSPTQAIEAAGNIFINTSGNPFLEVKTSGAGNNPFIRIKADTNYWDLQTLFSNTNDELDFRYNGTSTMMIDKNGQVTKPLQCAFNVQASTNQSNIAVASYVRVVFGAEHFDIGGNFASNTFTAPVTGKYQLNVNLRIDEVANNSTYYLCYLTTSNQGYYQTLDSDAATLSYHSFVISVVADMDANDTAVLDVYQAGGTQQTDIVGYSGDPVTHFSGYLLG